MTKKQSHSGVDQRALEDALQGWAGSFVTHTTLPSRGKLYREELPDEQKDWDGSVSITPWTGFHEKTLAAAKGTFSELMDDMLKGCVHDCPLPLARLLVIDRVALLVQVRALSVGEEYTVNVTCASCQEVTAKTVDLYQDVEVKYLESDELTEPFCVDLPNCGVRVFYRLLRGEDERKIASWSDNWKQNHKSAHTDEGYLYRLARHVVSMEVPTAKGTVTLTMPEDEWKIRMVFDKMVMRDTDAFKKSIAEIDFGYELDLSCRCEACGHVTKFLLSMSPEFFRPAERQDGGDS